MATAGSVCTSCGYGAAPRIVRKEGFLRCAFAGAPLRMSGSGPAHHSRQRLSIVRAAKRPPIPNPPAVFERFRLDNLSPQPGSKQKKKRKGRGTASGHGDSCGRGMRGQGARSGESIRGGFAGGSKPLYRQLPKLKGIAGRMKRGIPKFVIVNLKNIVPAYSDGEEVSLETLKAKRLINPTGNDRHLPLKILGDAGELQDSDMKKLTIKARAFSAAAKSKLESAGCTLITIPGRKKWLRASILRHIARADEYYAKKRAAAAAAAAGGGESPSQS